MSRIIQIAVSTGDEHYPDMLYALCEDGSLWHKTTYPQTDQWEQIETPTPQGKQKEGAE